MKESGYQRLVPRAILLTGILLGISGVVVFARGASILLQLPYGVQDAAPPSVTIDPEALDFGEQVVGKKSKPNKITVMNRGGKPLHIDSLTGCGDNWRDFSIVSDTCTGATIAPQTACVIEVAFSPSRTEERHAKLELTNNAPDTPQTVSLSGEGIKSNDTRPLAR